jgi:ABC-2 type transport system ATP-binding protein
VEVIRTDNLVKNYGNTIAVTEVSVNVSRGEIYGFLGLNGAGKTTLIRMLLGMIKPDSGTAYLFGKSVTHGFPDWNKAGYLVETPFSYPNLTVYENLEVVYLLRNLKEKQAINSIIERLSLTSYRDVKCENLSLGNRQRLGLAKALIHNPEVLILDEPINGLDPAGIMEVRDLLKELASNGCTIFLSSHILGEISKIADRIGIIHKGSLIRELNVPELENEILKKLILQTNENERASEVLKNRGYTAMRGKESLEISETDLIRNPETVSEILSAEGIFPKQLYIYREDLEHYFLRVIDQAN